MAIMLVIRVPTLGPTSSRVEQLSSTVVGQCADFQARPEILVVLPCSNVMQVAKNTWLSSGWLFRQTFWISMVFIILVRKVSIFGGVQKTA